jgi:hypothetical protein
MARRIIDRNGTITPKEIDKGIKNIWKWEWLAVMPSHIPQVWALERKRKSVGQVHL